MRAVRLVAAKRLELVELPDPAPGPGEVVVRVAAAGICGSDLSCYKTGVFSGSVLGHEFAGFVEEVGPGVTGVAAGDPVAVDPKIPCGTCESCVAGAPNRCIESLTNYLGGGRDGGFAEFVRAPAASMRALPGGLAPEDACLTEPLSISIHGLNRADARPGENVLVIGLGPIGLLAIAAITSRGGGAVVGVDPVEARRNLAATLGAERTTASVADVQGPFPLVVESSGRPEMVLEAVNRTTPGGRVLLLGVAMAEATIATMVHVTREINLIGAIGSGDSELAEAVRLLASTPAIAGIITKRVPLVGLPDAFDSLLAPTGDAKIVTDPRL